MAAWQIKQHLAQQATVDTRFGRFDFAVKVTVAAGEVTWAIWQQDESETAVQTPSRQSATYYFEGTALAQCLEADIFAEAGEVVATSAVALQLPKTAVTLQPVDAYYRLQAVDPGYVASYPPLVDRETAVAETGAAAFFSEDLRTLPTRGEFRQVVTVFVNLQSLPRDRDFANAFFQLLNQYGGYLCRVGRIGAQDPGGTLLLFWGAPHSYENNVTRALQFILDFRAAVATPLKAGITTSLAYAGFIGAPQREEYTCHGTYVNLAARQMVTANWSEIWLDEETSRQAGPVFDLVPGDEYQFKGFAAKRLIFQLRGQQEAEGSPFFRGAMVGRQAELAQLETAVQPLGEGKFGGVVMIRGEVGIGKSRLVHGFLEQTAILETATYFLCQTDDIMRQSLNPFRYFLRDYFEQSSLAATGKNREHFDHILDSLITDTQQIDLRAELERTRSFLGALLNLHWPGSLYEQLEPELRFANTLLALKALIKAESLRQPLLIQLEDAHWLDADSQTFLADLTNNVDDYPFLVIITARPMPTDTAVIETLVPAEVLQASINLTILTKTETAELAATRLHGSVSAELVDLLMARGEGNPFFVEQILLYLQEQSLLGRNGRGWNVTNESAATGLPMDIRAVMVSRLDRLPVLVRHTVQTASVLGREFSLPILAQMMPQETDAPLQVQAAETAIIWTALGEERYLFQHILLRDAAYEMQLQAQRRHLHHQAAMAIEKLFATDLSPYYGELAYHYEHALAIDKACHYLKQAGDIAQAAYQNEAALDFYNRLLALLPSVVFSPHNDSSLPDQATNAESAYLTASLTIDTLLEKGKVLKLIGQLASAQEALTASLDKATQIQDKDRQSQVKIELGDVLEDMGHDDEGLRHARQALAYYETIGDKKGQATAMRQIATIFNHMGDHDQARIQLHQLLEMFEATGDHKYIARVLNSLGISYSQKGEFIRAERFYKQAIAISRENGMLYTLSSTLGNLAIACWYQLKCEQALAAAQEAQQLNQAIGNQQGYVFTLGNMAAIYLSLGKLDKALDYNEQALQMAQELGQKQTIAILLGNIANIYRYQKAYEQALAYYDEAISYFREIKADYFACMSFVDKAKILFIQEEYIAAQQINDEAVQMAERTNRKEVLFEGEINAAKLENVLGQADKARRQLQAMLAESEDDIERGRLHYELWRMDMRGEHGRLALTLLRAVKDDLIPESLERLAELETAVAAS